MFDTARVRQLCAALASQGGNSMARKVGQIIARGDRRWLIRVYLGRDHETNKRNYHNRTLHGSMREAQAYLTRKLRERDLGRDLEGAKITLNEYLERGHAVLSALLPIPRHRRVGVRARCPSEHSQLPLLGFRGRPGRRCKGRPRNRYGAATRWLSLALDESGFVASLAHRSRRGFLRE